VPTVAERFVRGGGDLRCCSGLDFVAASLMLRFGGLLGAAPLKILDLHSLSAAKLGASEQMTL